MCVFTKLEKKSNVTRNFTNYATFSLYSNKTPGIINFCVHKAILQNS